MAARTDEVAPGVSRELAVEVVERAANDYERWERQLSHVNNCERPIRLVGRVEEVDRPSGEMRTTFDSDREVDRTLLVACGDRRETHCRPCSERYRADAYQLVAAGIRGGKGVPETVAEHPMLFATFTAPSFGAVHAHRSSGSTVHPCRPRRAGKCPHRIPLSCWKRHDSDDELVGQPLCPKCFDYEAQVLWNALAPELWRRTTIATQRSLAMLAGVSTRRLSDIVRLSYLKIAEYQRRGALHFHAVIRLDAAAESAPPPDPFTVELLERALSEAAARTTAPTPIEGVVTRWGSQLELRRIAGAGELTPKSVAGYIAKYATKSSASYWEVHRVDDEDDIDRLRVPAHVRSLVRAAWRLGGRRELQGLRLRRTCHQLGFKGHWSSKSRFYSTTYRALRRARRNHVRAKATGSPVPIDAWGRPQGEDLCEVVASWRFVSQGFRTSGEEYLARSTAARAREWRRLAWEELRTVTDRTNQ